MKIGIQLPEAERVATWQEVSEIASTAEDVGADSLWVGDHLQYRLQTGEVTGPWESWTILAALAAVTKRVELGPLVACVNFRNPGLLVKEALTVNEISGGRLILGLGVGWHRPEFEAFGLPYETRFDRFAEAIEIIASLVRDGRTDYAGQFYSMADCRVLPRRERDAHLPLMIGAAGSRALQAALPAADAWNGWYSWFNNDLEGYLALRSRIDSACEAVGRDPATLERTVALLVALEGATGRPSVDATERPVQPLPSEPRALIQHLQAFAEAGVSHVQLVLDPITRSSVEALAPVFDELRDFA